MLFTGFSEHTIDAKQRLAVPAKYRNQWDAERDGKAWFCFPWAGTVGGGGHLRLYTESSFTKLAQATDDEAKLAPDPDLALLKTRLFGITERLEMDTAGRVQVPKLHMDVIGLTSEVAVVGAGDHLEVWERSSWVSNLRANVMSLTELAQRVQAKGLRTF
ncbi:MAG: hypothetical protein IT438_00995 [Phycisphaerales bacterium]|nr:hypothetical protein [Phycisphaerales bacterium]